MLTAVLISACADLNGFIASSDAGQGGVPDAARGSEATTRSDAKAIADAKPRVDVADAKGGDTRDTNPHDGSTTRADSGRDASGDVSTGHDARPSDSQATGHDAGDTGASCSGGGQSCSSASECGTPPPCMVARCTNHCCTTAQAPVESSCGATQNLVCTASGQCVECLSPDNCPATGTKCLAPTCSSQNVCGTTPTAVNTACTDNGGHVCSGAGACVQCTPTDTAACPALQGCNATGQCVLL